MEEVSGLVELAGATHRNFESRRARSSRQLDDDDGLAALAAELAEPRWRAARRRDAQAFAACVRAVLDDADQKIVNAWFFPLRIVPALAELVPGLPSWSSRGLTRMPTVRFCGRCALIIVVRGASRTSRAMGVPP